MTDYKKQAEDFLQATSTTLTAEFEKFDYYFDDDKQKRNIFKITLRNDVHKYSFCFGSSLKDSLKNSDHVIYEDTFDFYFGLKYEGLKYQYLSYSAKIKIADLKNAPDFKSCTRLIDKAKVKSIYEDFVQRNSGKYHKINIIPFNDFFERIVIKLVNHTTEFARKNWGQGIQAETIVFPTAYDILACIEKYEVTDFEDFCSNYGYDSDSRKAFKTYKAVKREWENVRKLFTDEQLEQLREIQ